MEKDEQIKQSKKNVINITQKTLIQSTDNEFPSIITEKTTNFQTPPKIGTPTQKNMPFPLYVYI